MPDRTPPRLAQAYWIILSLVLACLALLTIAGYLILSRPKHDLPLAAALQDAELRQEVIAQLVSENRRIFDSHVDADVGRVQLPNLDNHELKGIRVSTNRFGMRERDYVMPKPDHVVRIVFLGDSMIFGHGANTEDRLGAQLEAWLLEKVPDFSGQIECLHLGVPSWNIQAETAYLRRQLSELQPDLVIHVILPNDIDDSAGTRGFGAAASFSSQRRAFADARISTGYPAKILGIGRLGLLRFGLDYESRHRYQAATKDLQRLAHDVERVGGQYRLLFHFRLLTAVGAEHIGRHLDQRLVTYISSTFSSNRHYTVADNDPHWNRAGHGKIAQLVYGLMTRDGLLPGLDLPPWEEASQVLNQIAEAGAREAARGYTSHDAFTFFSETPPSNSLDLTALDPSNVFQIHGGLDQQARVSPYASMLLKNDGAHLRVVGRTLPHPELSDARVEIFVDSERVGDIVIQPDMEINLTFPLPKVVADRPFLSIRFEANDYVYSGLDLQHCVVFQLHRLAIEA